MLDWTIAVELFSLVLLVVLMFAFYIGRRTDSYTTRIFAGCLWLSFISVSLNIICVISLLHTNFVPRAVNIVLNCLYFAVTTIFATLAIYYIIYLLLEHASNRRLMLCSTWILGSLLGIYLLMVATNPFTGLIFSLDSQGEYSRGPMINFGYLIVFLEIVLLYVDSWIYRSGITPPIKNIILILPTTVLLFIVYQVIFPDIMLNGGMLLLVNMILMLNFQSRRADVDSLTMISNRISFLQEIDMLLKSKREFQVVVFSLKNFTFVNQNYGHHNGDGLLIRIASWLSKLYPNGKAYRLSDMRFALLIPYREQKGAEDVLLSVCSRFKHPWTAGSSNDVTLETNVAELIHTNEDWKASDVIEFLWYSLMKAKNREDHLVRFSTDTYSDLEQRRHMLQLVQRSIKEDKLEVWYQPLFNCETHEYDSAEALLRIRDENGNLVSTDFAISVAEECGLMDKISWAVLDNICSLLGSSKVPGLKSVLINLSMQQFMSDDMPDRIKACLDKYNVNPKQLKIEITERLIAQDIERAKMIMGKLRKLNIGFYLDDFGTGYSNLSTVLSFNFDCIKLDRSLIKGVPDEKTPTLMTKSVLQLFHNIGCKVIAEGVERSEQANTLLGWGADMLQGYFFAMPLSKQDLIDFLSAPPKHKFYAVRPENDRERAIKGDKLYV